jgi:hypothetical protein
MSFKNKSISKHWEKGELYKLMSITKGSIKGTNYAYYKV